MEPKKEKQEAFYEIDTGYTGYLVVQDSYYRRTIKGVGRIYQQTVTDTYSCVPFGKLHTTEYAIALMSLTIEWYPSLKNMKYLPCES